MNDRIRVREVRLVSADGEQLGIKTSQEALSMARAAGLDLVEVAANASPPVCRIMDWGKHKYEQDQRAKEAKRKQSQVVVKEMKFRPKIDVHDYETKKKHVVRFLEEGSKVKITIMFRGREMSHTELGRKILDQLAEDLSELATPESMPKLDGRNMLMVLAPLSKEPKVQHKRGSAKGKGKGKSRRGPDRTESSVDVDAEVEALNAAAEADAEALDDVEAGAGTGTGTDDADLGEGETVAEADLEETAEAGVEAGES
ncbi:MAG: translation initiation factor IF-3 [Acidimicrobiia bacterium]